MNEDAHPAGHYEAHPDVTWDLAEERWLGTRGRSDVLHAFCRSCGWRDGGGGLWGEGGEQVVTNPELQRKAMARLSGKHWYECPGDPAVQFRWAVASVRDFTGASVDYRIYHRGPDKSESTPFVQLHRDGPYLPRGGLSPLGRVIKKKLIAKGVRADSAAALAKYTQAHGLKRTRQELEDIIRRGQPSSPAEVTDRPPGWKIAGR